MAKFEWDEAKDRANRTKHGLGFSLAIRVFADPNLVLIEDRVDGEGEQRWHALGMIGAQVLLIVVHVYREGKNGEETTRIISARKANKRECRVYLGQTA